MCSYVRRSKPYSAGISSRLSTSTKTPLLPVVPFHQRPSRQCDSVSMLCLNDHVLWRYLIVIASTENSVLPSRKSFGKRSGRATWLPVSLKAFPDSVSKAQASTWVASSMGMSV